VRHISPAQTGREKRRRRIRGKVTGTAERPRLSVFRSNARIYAQVIDDTKGHTLAAASSTEQALLKTGKSDAATQVGKLVADRAKSAGVTKVVFDRGGYLYHGRVKALADAAREGGLEF
jgi:large subunit ribosomal protein L18